MANQVLEAVSVLFRVLGIGLGVVITQMLGGERPLQGRLINSL